MLEAFVPDVPPVIPPVTVGSDQLYFVPVGTALPFPLVGVILNPVPLHAVAVCEATDGIGYTVTVIVFVVIRSLSFDLCIPQVTVYVMVLVEFTGVTVAVTGPWNLVDLVGLMVPRLTDHSQSKLTTLSSGVKVTVNGE